MGGNKIMASLKEILRYRKQQEVRTFRIAKNEKERAVAMAVEYTITDIEKELESIQLEILEKLWANMGTMMTYGADSSTREHFYKINLGLMIVYRRLFGTEEYDKLMSGEGMHKELDLSKIISIIAEVKK